MENKFLILVLVVLLVFEVSGIIGQEVDYDKILEGVDEDNWNRVVNNYVKFEPSVDNSEILNRLFKKDYVNDGLILESWDSLEGDFSEGGSRRNLWESLDSQNKKKIVEAFYSDKDNIVKRYTELFNAQRVSDRNSEEENLQGTAENLNEILGEVKVGSDVEKIKVGQEALFKAVSRKDIVLLEGTELTVDNDMNFLAKVFENGKAVSGTFKISPDTLPSSLERLELRRPAGQDSGDYYLFAYDEGDKPRAVISAGYGVESYSTKSGEEYEEDISRWKITGGIYDSEGKEAFFDLNNDKSASMEVEKNGKIKMWGEGHLGNNLEERAYVQIGSERIFPHPDGIKSPGGLGYASYNQVDEDGEVLAIQGAGQSTRYKGKGFSYYFVDEGVLDFSGGYKSGDKSMLSVLNGGSEIRGRFVNGQQVTFGVFDEANIAVKNDLFFVNRRESTDSGKGFTEYAFTRNANEYVNRKTENVQAIVNEDSGESEVRVSNGEGPISSGASDTAEELAKRPGSPESVFGVKDSGTSNGENSEGRGSTKTENTGTRVNVDGSREELDFEKLSKGFNDYARYGKIKGSLIPDNPNQVFALDFSASWCGPCQQMSRNIGDGSSLGGGLVNIDIDQQRALANRFGISAVPAVVYIKNGLVVDRKVGYHSVNQLNEVFNRYNK